MFICLFTIVIKLAGIALHHRFQGSHINIIRLSSNLPEFKNNSSWKEYNFVSAYALKRVWNNNNSSIFLDCIDIVIATVNAKISIADVILSDGFSQLIKRQLFQFDTEFGFQSGSKLHNFVWMKATSLIESADCVGKNTDKWDFHAEILFQNSEE